MMGNMTPDELAKEEKLYKILHHEYEGNGADEGQCEDRLELLAEHHFGLKEYEGLLDGSVKTNGEAEIESETETKSEAEARHETDAEAEAKPEAEAEAEVNRREEEARRMQIVIKAMSQLN